MTDKAAVHKMRSSDLEGFALWYGERHRRRQGSAVSPRTIESRLTHLRVCSAITGSRDELSLGTALSDRLTVEHLVEGLLVRMTPGAARGYLYSLIAFGEYAVAKQWIRSHAVVRSDIPPNNPPPAIRVYEALELEALVQAARGMDLRWWAFVAFLADSGRRAGEVLSLRWDWFHLRENPPFVDLPVNKTNRPQYIPLTSRLATEVFSPANVDRLRSEVRLGRRRFARSPLEHPFPFTYSNAYKRFNNFCERSGLPRHGALHLFRHTFVTHRLAAGVPIQAVSALVGHSSITTTERRYSHVTALDFARYVEPPRSQPDA